MSKWRKQLTIKVGRRLIKIELSTEAKRNVAQQDVYRGVCKVSVPAVWEEDHGYLWTECTSLERLTVEEALADAKCVAQRLVFESNVFLKELETEVDHGRTKTA